MSELDGFHPLARDGDERGIKRLYARLLKHTRPDEDPDGFQALHAAYQHALSRCRTHARHVDATTVDQVRDDAHMDPRGAQQIVPHAMRADADEAAGDIADTSPAQHTADVPVPVSHTLRLAVDGHDHATLADPTPADAAGQLLTLALQYSAQEYAERLERQMLHWSLHTRHAASAVLLQWLRAHDVALSREHVDALATTMGWMDVLAGVDPMELHRLRERAHARWLTQPDQHEALQAMLGFKRGPEGYRRLQQRLATLQQPRTRWQNLRAALLPAQLPELRELLRVLGHTPDQPPPPGLDPGQVRFWDAARTPGNREHTALAFLRSTVIAAVMVPLMVGYWMLTSDKPVPASKALTSMALLMLAVVIGQAVWLGYLWLLDWQTNTEDVPTSRPWTRRFAVPCLAVLTAGLTAALMYIDGDTVILLPGCLALGVMLMRIGALRLATRRGRELDVGTIGGMALFVAIITIFPALLMACVFWGIDAWRHRGYTSSHAR